MPAAAWHARDQPPAVGQMDRTRGRATPAVQPAAPVVARTRRRHRLADGSEQRAIGGEQGDVRPQIGGGLFERRLLLRLRRPDGWQHVLRERPGHFECVAGRAGVAELAPHESRAQRKHREADQHGEIDPQIEPSHQSCCLANT